MAPHKSNENDTVTIPVNQPRKPSYTQVTVYEPSPSLPPPPEKQKERWRTGNPKQRIR